MEVAVSADNKIFGIYAANPRAKTIIAAVFGLTLAPTPFFLADRLLLRVRSGDIFVQYSAGNGG